MRLHNPVLLKVPNEGRKQSGGIARFFSGSPSKGENKVGT